MRKCLLSLVLLSSVCCWSAQQAERPSAQPQPSPAKARPSSAASQGPPSKEQVAKLLELLQVRRNVESMFMETKEQVMNEAEQELRRRVPEPSVAQIARLHGMINNEFDRLSAGELVESIIPVYQRHFTKGDIDAIVAFYSSPVGQKMQREQQSMMRESMQAAGSRQQQKMEAILQKIQDQMDQVIQDESPKQDDPPKKPDNP